MIDYDRYDRIRAVQWQGDALRLLDQRVLPLRTEFVVCTTANDVAAAIRNLTVRGAPAIGIAAARVLGLSPGDALLLTVLLASASYIAVPAALRIALPDANPGVYVPMALALTFPFNIAIGIPLYMAVIVAMVQPAPTPIVIN